MKLFELSLFLLGSSQALLASKLQKPLGVASSSSSTPSSSYQVHSSNTVVNNNSNENSAPPYRESLVSLHKSLVDIQSISYEENEVGRFLVDYLTERGFVTEVQVLPPSNSSKGAKPRFNVLAWPGGGSTTTSTTRRRRDPQPRVLVTSHIDTVPPYIPYSISPAEGPLGPDTLIAGRGSVDAKGSVAAQITALLSLLEDIVDDDDGEDDEQRRRRRGAEDPRDVMLLYVVGEEVSGDGMLFFSDSDNYLSPSFSSSSFSSSSSSPPPPPLKAAIFGEPTEGRLACGHKGFFACEVRARGRAGHSGYPWLGRSATEALMRGLVAVLDAELGSSAGFGRTTVNVGAIEGGVAANVIAEAAGAKIAGRVAIGPEAEGGRIVAERVAEVLKGVDGEAFETECKTGYGVVRCDCSVDGFETITVNYGTDVPNLKGNHTRYLYGPGSILVAHGADEAIKLKDLETAVEDYKKLILHALKI